MNPQVLDARRISSAVPYQLDYASRIQIRLWDTVWTITRPYCDNMLSHNVL